MNRAISRQGWLVGLCFFVAVGLAAYTRIYPKKGIDAMIKSDAKDASSASQLHIRPWWTVPPAALRRGDDIAVEATVETGGAPSRLVVHIVAKNRSTREVFIMNGLWYYGKTRDRMDSEVAYRFVDKGSLRLLIGPPPMPENMSGQPPIPHATRLGPGKDLALTVQLATPVEEYSAGQPAESPATTPVRVDKIIVIVQYALDPGKVTVSHLDQKLLDTTASPAYLLSASYEVAAPPFEVLRRNEDIVRVRLPGE